jgi:RHS repeat-associated protein
MHVHDKANRLLEDETFLYQYDPRGNLISKEDKETNDTTIYTYDPENRLIRADLPDGTVATYRYDALGRRIEKDVDGAITKYVYDREDILVEYDEDDTPIRSYTHGPDIDEPLSLLDIDAAESFFFHSDRLRSIREITGEEMQVVQRFRFSAFGSINVELDPEFPQPFAFTGRERDDGTELVYFRARHYYPESGRFVQRDPVGGDLWEAGSLNQYLYVQNNPVLKTDPSGLTVADTAYDLLLKALVRPRYQASGLPACCGLLDDCSNRLDTRSQNPCDQAQTNACILHDYQLNKIAQELGPLAVAHLRDPRVRKAHEHLYENSTNPLIRTAMAILIGLGSTDGDEPVQMVRIPGP